MALIDPFLVDEIAVEPFVTDDSVDGLPSYGARVVSKARIEARQRTVRRAGGTTLDVQTVVATLAAVGPRDRVWIAPSAGNDAPRTFPVGHVFLDADARSPLYVDDARRIDGAGGHVEFGL